MRIKIICGLIFTVVMGYAQAPIRWTQIESSVDSGYFAITKVNFKGEWSSFLRKSHDTLYVDGVIVSTGGGSFPTGSGTLNYVPKWTPNGNTLGDSQIFDNGTKIGFGTNTPNSGAKYNFYGTTSNEGVLIEGPTNASTSNAYAALIIRPGVDNQNSVKILTQTTGTAGTQNMTWKWGNTNGLAGHNLYIDDNNNNHIAYWQYTGKFLFGSGNTPSATVDVDGWARLRTQASSPANIAGNIFFATIGNWFKLQNGTNEYFIPYTSVSGAAFTNERVIYADANGALQQTSGFSYNGTELYVNATTDQGDYSVQASRGFVSASTVSSFKNPKFFFGNTTAGFASSAMGNFAFSLGGSNTAGYPTLSASPYPQSGVGPISQGLIMSVSMHEDFEISGSGPAFLFKGVRRRTTGAQNALQYSDLAVFQGVRNTTTTAYTFFAIDKNGNGSFQEPTAKLVIAGSTATETLTVIGDASISDLTATPTKLTGSTSGNILGDVITGTGLSLTTGTLSVNNATVPFGSGLTDRVATWADANTLTYGILYDDGSKVGINTAPDPTTWLYLNDTVTENSNWYGLATSLIFKPSVNMGALTEQVGNWVYIYVDPTNTHTVASLEGIQVTSEGYGTGNVTQIYAVRALAASATVTTNLFGVYADASVLSGATVTNRYVLYLSNLSDAASPSGNDYSLYNSSQLKSYFRGSIGIGTAAITPARTVDIDGELRIRDRITDTPTEILGADGDGDVAKITIGTGLSFTAGTLSSTATTYTFSNALTEVAGAVTWGGSLTGSTTITGGAYSEIHTYDALAGGNGMYVTSTSTGASGNSQKLVHINLSGANATSSQKTVALYISNGHTGTGSINYGVQGYGLNGSTINVGVYGSGTGTGARGVAGTTASDNGFGGEFWHTGTTGTGYGLQAYAQGAKTTNIAASFSATEATNNYAIIVASGKGRVGFGTGSPAKDFHVVGEIRFESLGTGTPANLLALTSAGDVVPANANLSAANYAEEGADLAPSAATLQTYGHYTVFLKVSAASSNSTLTLPSPTALLAGVDITVSGIDSDGTYITEVVAGTNELWEQGTSATTRTVTNNETITLKVSQTASGTYQWVITNSY